jgi:ketosteroid isomerase-like protein
MSRENVETVRRGYELYAAGEIGAVADLTADDAELAGAGGLGVEGTAAGTRRGPRGFVQASEEALEAFEDYRIEPEDFIDAGDTVVVPVRIAGRGRASRMELEMSLAHLWVLRDGKVITGEVYRTTEEALEAARGSEA